MHSDCEAVNVPLFIPDPSVKQLMDDLLIGAKLRELSLRPDHMVKVELLEVVLSGEPPRERALAGTGIPKDEDSHGVVVAIDGWRLIPFSRRELMVRPGRIA